MKPKTSNKRLFIILITSIEIVDQKGNSGHAFVKKFGFKSVYVWN